MTGGGDTTATAVKYTSVTLVIISGIGPPPGFLIYGISLHLWILLHRLILADLLRPAFWATLSICLTLLMFFLLWFSQIPRYLLFLCFFLAFYNGGIPFALFWPHLCNVGYYFTAYSTSSLCKQYFRSNSVSIDLLVSVYNCFYYYSWSESFELFWFRFSFCSDQDIPAEELFANANTPLSSHSLHILFTLSLEASLFYLFLCFHFSCFFFYRS